MLRQYYYSSKLDSEMAATSTPPPTLATLPEVCLVHVCAFLNPRSVELFSLSLCRTVRAALRSGVALNEVWYDLTSREWESTPRYARGTQGGIDGFPGGDQEALSKCAFTYTQLPDHAISEAIPVSLSRLAFALSARAKVVAKTGIPALCTLAGNARHTQDKWPWRQRFASAWLFEERAYSRPWGHALHAAIRGLARDEYLPRDLAQHTVLLGSLCSLSWKLWYSTQPAGSPGQGCMFTRLCSPPRRQ